MPGPYTDDITDEEKKLDAALCDFLNQASDPFTPVSQWEDYVWTNFVALSKAYNEWYRVRFMKKEPKSMT